MNLNQTKIITILLLLTIILWGCRSQDAETVTPTLMPEAALDTAADPVNPTIAPTAVPPTPIPPTPTPTEPLAAIVNGEQILLATYEKQLARFQLGNPNGTIDYKPIALNSIIDNTLITQAALEAGYTVSEEQIDQEIALLIESIQGRENYDAWLESNLYTEEELRQEIVFGHLSAPLLSEVAASIPTTSIQVRARYIKVADETLATTILTQLQNGENFESLANQFSIPMLDSANPNGGDMGFFGQDWPLEGIPQMVQNAAFGLEVGQTSAIIANSEADGTVAYYLIQTIEEGSERPLPPPLLDQLRQKAILDWTETLRQNADILLLVEIGS